MHTPRVVESSPPQGFPVPCSLFPVPGCPDLESEQREFILQNVWSTIGVLVMDFEMYLGMHSE